MRLELLISYYNSTTNREDRVHNNMDDAISRTLYTVTGQYYIA